MHRPVIDLAALAELVNRRPELYGIGLTALLELAST